RAIRLDLANATTVPESFGSGVVIDKDKRQILTNYHVVRGATKVYVRLPSGKGSYANIHAADPRSDLAVLQLIDDKIALQSITIGDARKVRKGQMVLSIANPYAAGFRDGSPSASWGIIANIRRRAPSTSRSEIGNNKTLHHYGTLFQLDARLNLGCSGGVVDTDQPEVLDPLGCWAPHSADGMRRGCAVPSPAPNRLAVGTIPAEQDMQT